MGFWDLFRPSNKTSPLPAAAVANDSLDIDSCVTMGWRSLPRLTAVILQVDSQNSAVAAEAAAAILADMSPSRLPQLDENIRRTFGLGYAGPGVVERLKFHGQSRWAVMGLVSFAPSGFVREAAIRELDAIETGQELPYLLVRANDWVHEVRRSARRAIFRRLRADYAEHFVRSLPMVTRLSTFRRVDHTDLVAQIEQLLLEQGREAVLQGIRSSDRWVRRACVNLLVKAAGGVFDANLSGALEDQDPVVSVRAVCHICTCADDSEFMRLIGRLDCFVHAQVRLALLESAASRQLPDVARIFYEALFDRSRSVRELARFVLRDDQRVAEGHVYAQALPELTGSRLLGALAGLGDIARPEHADAVRRFVGPDYAPRLRFEALATYSRLTKELAEVLLPALADQNPGISRLAFRLLVGCRVGVSEHEVSPLLRSPLQHVRHNALGMLLRQGKWAGLRWALTAFETPGLTDDDLKLALSYVECWEGRFNRSFARPRPEELREIGALLARVSERLSSRSVRFVQAVVRTEES